MTIHCVDAQQQPIADAIVSVANAPVEVADIAMITDDNGDISIQVDEPGEYTFSINHNSQLYQASVNLSPGDSAKTVVVQ